MQQRSLLDIYAATALNFVVNYFVKKYQFSFDSMEIV